MPLKIYNTLTRKKEEFVPLKKGEVGMYVCGPTVYNYIHIGNARPFIIFEVVRRFLKFKGYRVRYIQNLTDIDDKMINNAKELKVKVSELAEKFIQDYFIDADSLNIERADVHPRATEHIKEIIELVKGLEEKGYAYEIDGDVFFDVSKFKDYGKLSGQNIEELKDGARVKIDERKKEAIDFALWKRAKEGEPSWHSPWGQGRPGWHVECSAMSMKYLGKTFDIHAGGSDLVFPHHENEIAQSEAYNNQQFVRYWMHNGSLYLNNQKMSKSLGNIMKVRDICKKYKGEVIRYFILSAHYRSPLNFSEEQLHQAERSLQRLGNAIFNVKHLLKKDKFRKSKDKDDESILEKRRESEQKFIEAMNDDFNTPVALSQLFGFARKINIYLNSPDPKNKEVIEETLKFYQELAGKILGILEDFDREESFEQEIEKLIKEREEARKERNWVESDRIRNKLQEKGILLEDTPSGVRWKKTK